MSRRLVTITLLPELIADELLKPTFPGVYYRTNEGVPKDATLRGCGWDFERNLLWFTFEHESFAEVPEGEMAPRFDGFSRLALHIPESISDQQKAEFERLTREQIERARALDPNPDAVVGG